MGNGVIMNSIMGKGKVVEVGDLSHAWRCKNEIDGVRCRNDAMPDSDYCVFCNELHKLRSKNRK